MRTRIRALAAFCAFLQVALPATVAYADARFDAAPVAPVHVESHAGALCAVVHPENCALCQFLSALNPLAQHQPVRLPDPPERLITTADRLPVVSLARSASPLARAPPALV
ncbi:MAG TPA: hypothetical protein VMC86_01765 [Gemmatimonadales bacterium]|nr:hypothetical protein [Gemmatimonadales bacterium]